MKTRAVKVSGRDAAQWLSITWASWWVYFTIAAGISEGVNPSQIAVQTVLAAMLFFGSVGLAWKWQIPGGLVLAAEGLAVMIGFPMMVGASISSVTISFVLATLALPPLVSGTLFVLSSVHRRNLHAR